MVDIHMKQCSHDFEMLKHNPQIVLDDFFLEDDDGKKPSEEHCGVNKLFEEITLPKKVLKTRDPVTNRRNYWIRFSGSEERRFV